MEVSVISFLGNLNIPQSGIVFEEKITYKSLILDRFEEILAILNVISLKPPIGIRSLPVTNNNKRLCLSDGISSTTCQNHLKTNSRFFVFF